MNCDCLQCIINNDDKRFTYDNEACGIRTISKSNERSFVSFDCNVSFRLKKINTHTSNKFRDSENYKMYIPVGKDFMDKTVTEKTCIPFLFCPICGTKSKIETQIDDFYGKLQNKITQ